MVDSGQHLNSNAQWTVSIPMCVCFNSQPLTNRHPSIPRMGTSQAGRPGHSIHCSWPRYCYYPAHPNHALGCLLPTWWWEPLGGHGTGQFWVPLPNNMSLQTEHFWVHSQFKAMCDNMWWASPVINSILWANIMKHSWWFVGGQHLGQERPGGGGVGTFPNRTIQATPVAILIYNSSTMCAWWSWSFRATGGRGGTG